MTVIHSPQDVQKHILKLRSEGKKIALVPTMGFLHQGHQSLIEEAKKRADIVVLSLFVNPKQFGPTEDFDRYPRDFDRDLALCETAQVDIVFAPSVQEMYPTGFQTTIKLGELTTVLCGKSRPSHFDGVAIVVSKLFLICQPHVAVFGQKDYQQVVIIKQLTADLNLPVAIFMAPIVREDNGLALSSRNKYLTEKERADAAIIHQQISQIKAKIKQGEQQTEPLKKAFKKALAEVDCLIDYIDIVSATNLRSLSEINEPCVIVAAVFFGKTRLIDNEIIELET